MQPAAGPDTTPPTGASAGATATPEPTPTPTPIYAAGQVLGEVPVTFRAFPEGVWAFVHGYPGYPLNGHYGRMEYVWMDHGTAHHNAMKAPKLAATAK